MLYTKYENSGSCSFRQEDFSMLNFKNFLKKPLKKFLPRDLLMQPIKTI